MENLELSALQADLTGTWDSPVMILEFYPADDSLAGRGKVISVGNQRTIDFDYILNDNGESPVLALTTPMTGVMEYEISEWASGNLTLVKKGYPTATVFVKRPA